MSLTALPSECFYRISEFLDDPLPFFSVTHQLNQEKNNCLIHVFHQITPNSYNNLPDIEKVSLTKFIYKKIISKDKKNNIESILHSKSFIHLDKIISIIEKIEKKSFFNFFKELDLQDHIGIFTTESEEDGHEIQNYNFNFNFFSKTRLFIKNNQFNIIPKEIKLFSNLYWLILNRNEIYSLPDEITNLNQLKFFECNHNYLKSLPDQFQKLSLRTIRLKDNCFNEIPIQLFRIQTLAHLYLNKNQIHIFPNDPPNAPNLHTLDLSDNKIQSIPKILWKLPNLDRISLDKNPLKISNLAKKILNKTETECAEFAIQKKASICKYFRENREFIRELGLVFFFLYALHPLRISLVTFYIIFTIAKETFRKYTVRR